MKTIQEKLVEIQEKSEVTKAPNPPLDAQPDSMNATMEDTTEGFMQETPHEELTREATHATEELQAE